MLVRMESIADEEEELDFEHVTVPSGKIGAKKMRKLQEKEEKARQREVCTKTGTQ